MRFRGFVLASLLASAPMASAQEALSANFSHLYDLDSTTLTYCSMVGINGDPYGSPIPVQGKIKTSGSSTTVTEVVTGSNPFTEVAVGDTLYVDKGTLGLDAVIVVARTDAANVTVSSAVNWDNGGAGRTFGFKKQTCGTGATNGWINVFGGLFYDITLQYDQGYLDALHARWECKAGGVTGAQPILI